MLGVERAVTQSHAQADSAAGRSGRALAARRRRREVERLRLRADRPSVDELRRRLEPVLHEQVQVVALVEHLDRARRGRAPASRRALRFFFVTSFWLSVVISM